MKIKLNRDLWNRKSGEEIETGEDHGTWAVNKGYAEMCEVEQIESPLIGDHTQNITLNIEGKKLKKVLNKAIEPKYKRNKLK